ncbi:MAG: hypothetical protein K9J38_10405 [Polynucleobacter sp.]|nr:hypothetical protein [Polynucleobacter sp.]
MNLLLNKCKIVSAHLQHGELTLVSRICLTSKASTLVQHPDHSINGVIDITKAVGLLIIAINGDTFSLQGLPVSSLKTTKDLNNFLQFNSFNNNAINQDFIIFIRV